MGLPRTFGARESDDILAVMWSRTLSLLLVGCAFRVESASLDATQADGMTIDGALVDATPVDAAVQPSCTNQLIDGDETAIDCGGSCTPCAVGLTCAIDADCLASICGTGVCRFPADCDELHTAHGTLGDASYSIDPDGAGGAAPFATFCDMTVDGGGWTLVGLVDGRHTMHAAWLVSAVNPAALETPAIPTASYASIDAVYLAVNGSTDVRLGNATRTDWVKWPLPAGRTLATWWRHAAGRSTIAGATQSAVTVTTSGGTTATCYQNVYGIMPFDMHGGSYPAASKNTTGNTSGNDSCLAIGTQISGVTADGFTQNGNGFDAPSDDATWPNTAYNVAPHVGVWLR